MVLRFSSVTSTNIDTLICLRIIYLSSPSIGTRKNNLKVARIRLRISQACLYSYIYTGERSRVENLTRALSSHHLMKINRERTNFNFLILFSYTRVQYYTWAIPSRQMCRAWIRLSFSHNEKEIHDLYKHKRNMVFVANLNGIRIFNLFNFDETTLLWAPAPALQ